MNYARLRRGVYAVAVTVAALLTFYGVLPPEAAPLWLALVLALLNVNTEQED